VTADSCCIKTTKKKQIQAAADGHGREETHQQKTTPATATADELPSSTTVEDLLQGLSAMPRSRLAEMKVQDLKEECRRRQLASSGTKYQILERLKPFEQVRRLFFNKHIFS
jgi:hypothetical protein